MVHKITSLSKRANSTSTQDPGDGVGSRSKGWRWVG